MNDLEPYIDIFGKVARIDIYYTKIQVKFIFALYQLHSFLFSLRFGNAPYMSTPKRAPVPILPPHPPNNNPVIPTQAIADRAEAKARAFLFFNTVGALMATKLPTKAGPAAVGLIRAAIAPVAPTAAVGVAKRGSDSFDAYSLKKGMKNAPAIVERIIGTKAVAAPAIDKDLYRLKSTKAAGATTSPNVDSNMERILLGMTRNPYRRTTNVDVQATCAIKPSLPPFPMSHFCRSKSRIMYEQTKPNTTAAAGLGMTACRAIPAKEPQSAASCNNGRLGPSAMADARAITDDPMTGPRLY